MKKLLPISVIAIFSVMPVFADNITASSTCTNGVLGTYTGSANIEANFDPNTINTTWYNNGTAMTVDSAYQSCTYAAPLTPPTPAPRAGYVFNGWTLRVPAIPACTIPSTLVSTNGSSYGYKNDSTGPEGANSNNTSDYNLTEDNTWGVTWDNGDKVTGVAFCSITSDRKRFAQTGNPGTIGGYANDGEYCWCHATHYKANGDSQCALSSPAWVFRGGAGLAPDCASYCASRCASRVQTNSDFRAAIFTGLVAQ